MRSIHKLLAVIVAVFMLATLFGCGESKLSTQEKSIRVSVIVKKRDANYWTVVKMGAEAAGKEFGVKVDFNGPTDENDIAGQIKIVEEAISEKVDAVVLAACDYTKLVEVAEKAISENIPVIIIDSDIHSDRTSSFIGTDNIEAGKLLGETAVDKVGESCNIAVMSFIKGAASSDQRDEGLYEVLKKHSSIKVLSSVYCNSDENIAEQLTEKLVQDYPELEAVICTNAYGTVGTARAIEKLGMSSKVKVIGFDSTPEEVDFMEKDIIQALVIQNPFSMGYLGVKYAIDATNKEALQKRKNTDSKVIDKDNMYLPENQKLVFPFTN